MSIKLLFSLYNSVIICIIESVDSVCRDSADMQYMIIQKISPILRHCKASHMTVYLAQFLWFTATLKHLCACPVHINWSRHNHVGLIFLLWFTVNSNLSRSNWVETSNVPEEAWATWLSLQAASHHGTLLWVSSHSFWKEMSDSEESNDPTSLSEASHSSSSGTPFQPQFASQMQQWVPPFYQQPF